MTECMPIFVVDGYEFIMCPRTRMLYDITSINYEIDTNVWIPGNKPGVDCAKRKNVFEIEVHKNVLT